MILFFLNDIERFKYFYYISLIVTGFVIAMKLPQFTNNSYFIILLLSDLLLGIIPLKYKNKFDFAINSGFIFVVILKFGLEMAILPVLAIQLVSYIIKFSMKTGIKRAIDIGLFNTIIIVFSNVVGLFLYDYCNTILNSSLSVLILWLFILLVNFVILFVYKNIYEEESIIDGKEIIYFLILSFLGYVFAFVSLSVLYSYGYGFYVAYFTAVMLILLYLYVMQKENYKFDNILGSLSKINEINISNRNNDIKEFVVEFHEKINRYLSIDCVGITYGMEKYVNSIFCKDANEKIMFERYIEENRGRKPGEKSIILLNDKKMSVILNKLEISDGQDVYLYYLSKSDIDRGGNKLFFDLLKKRTEIIVENILLYNKAKEEFLKTIEMIVSMIEAKDKLTAGHSIRVAKYSYLIGQELGLKKKELDDLKFAALLHDIGKIAIPENILNKKTELTDREFDIMRRHTIIGENLIKTIDSLKDSLPGIVEHHERYDGSGYPRGIKGDEISLQGKIIAIADAFDAVTSNRVYRYPLKRIDAMAMIIAGSYSRFDPKLVEIFTEIIKRYNGEFINDDTIKYVKI